MRHNRWFGWLVVGIFTLLLMNAGCGLKSDPFPPRMKLPAAVLDLSSVSSRDGVLLAWSLDPLEIIGSFQILRSEAVRRSEACPGCPQEYQPLRTVQANDANLRREGARTFFYVDRDVRAAYFYSYRIVVCNPAGQCGAPSNESGVIHVGQ